MRIVIFGTGLYCEKRIGNIENSVEIIAYIDNYSILWGKKRNGISILSPDSVKTLQYDKIVLMSLSSDEMKKQLLDIGVKKEKIFYYEEFYAEISKGKLNIYFDKIKKGNGKKILIAVHILGYHGASIISLYTARVLQQRGYQVVIIASEGDEEFIKNVTKEGFLIFIYGGLFCAEIEEMFWIQEFDYVIVNTYSLMKFALNVNKIKPGFWWLHDSENAYKHRRDENFDKLELNNLKIFAVSEVAKKYFNNYYPDIKVDCFKYGIPDKYSLLKLSEDKLILAIIGYVNEVKGQDILLDAISKLNESEKEKIEMWIIGKIGDNVFSKKIKEIVEIESTVKILGEFNSEKMRKAYAQIDVVINSSRQDACPTVVVEGMMYGKICVTSNNTGMAPFIENGENGFVFESENAEDLCDKIRWILSHRECLQKIGENARKTYLEYFTMEKFGNRLENVINGVGVQC